MRITKIADKDRKYSHLRVERGEQQSDLISSSPHRLTSPKETARMLEARKEAFQLSILAKTLRREVGNKALSEKLEQMIACAEQRKEYRWRAKIPSIEAIRLCLKPRYTSGATLEFDLAALLHQSIGAENEPIDPLVLQPYFDSASEGSSRSEICNYRALSLLRHHLESLLTDLLKERFHVWRGAPQVPVESIRRCFQPRFAEGESEKLGFDLAELIHRFIEKKAEYRDLRPYVSWAKGFKKKKIEHLSESLHGNAILNAQTSTPSEEKTSRTRALEACVDLLLDRKNSAHRLNLSTCESRLLLPKLAHSLQSTYSEHHDSPRLGSLLKSCLQQHCGDIYKEYKRLKETAPDQAVAEDDLTKQYRLEIHKYLERHFPVKGVNKQARRLKHRSPAASGQAATRPDLSAYLQESEISSTIALQLQNATLQYMIQQGKQRHYARDSYSSADLMEIRRTEAFASHFINASAFAANNLRNAIKPDEQDDILLKTGNALKSITEHATRDDVWGRLRSFFELGDRVNNDLLHAIGADEQCFNSFVMALRHGIAGVRNEVVHFRKNLLDTKLEKFPADADSHAGQLMAHEIAQLGELYREQLRSSRVLEYYQAAEVERLLSQLSLVTRALPFVPSFHKVFTQGRTLQVKSGNAYMTSCYFAHDPQEEDGCLARKNALHLLYEGAFARAILREDQHLFARAVAEVRKVNKNQAKKKEQYAFEQIDAYQPDDTPKGYLQRIHSRLVLDEQVKRAQGKLAHDETGYFQQFLYYVFMKAFDLFLVERGFAFLLCDASPTARFASLTRAQRADRVDAELRALALPAVEMRIDLGERRHLAFWCFAKLLNPHLINELSNQILKYQLLCEQQEGGASNSGDLDVYREILGLCRLSAERFPTIGSDAEHQALTSYVEPRLLKRAPYMQEDGKTPVLFASVQLARRYATEERLAAVLSDSRVDQAQLDEWGRLEHEIADQVKERAKLHQALCTKKALGNHDPGLERYRVLQAQIDRYNWLRNKIELVHVRSLHQLLIDILGRLAGFIRLFERNLRFYHDFLGTRGVKQYNDKVWGKGMPKFVPPDWPAYLMSIFQLPDDWRGCRNYVAHFNYIGQREYSLLELMHKVRLMMAHDRKLKNAVMTSMIDLLDRHGVSIAFSSDDLHQGKVVITRCKPKRVKHLKKIDVDLVDEEYAEMVHALLEYKPIVS